MIYMDNNKKVPLYEQIYNGLLKMMEDGELQRGSQLKPIRNLAQELNVSNNTVSKAYQQLASEGYIKSVPGSGFYVRKIVPGKRKSRSKSNTGNVDEKSLELRYDFDYERMETCNFPWSKWRHYLEQAISEEAYSASIGFEDKKGNRKLRSVLCDYMLDTRGIHCEPRQVIICAGKQYAMDILMEILPERIEKVAVEDPCMHRIRKSFLDQDKKIKAIPVTEHGLEVSELEKSDCQMVYTMPSHNYPTGYVMSLTRRVQLLEWAKRNNNYIIEDDFEHEFFDAMQNIPAIKSMDNNKFVIYMHTPSQILSPSIRCTYLVLPESLLSAYEQRYKYYYTALPVHNQKALAQFIQDGHMEKQAKKINQYNRKKCGKIRKMITTLLPGEVRCEGVSSNSHLMVTLLHCSNEGLLMDIMEENGVKVYSARKFWKNTAELKNTILILGYHALPDEILLEACEKFAESLREYLSIEQM